MAPRADGVFAEVVDQPGLALGQREGVVNGRRREDLAGVVGVLLVEPRHVVAGKASQRQRARLHIEGTGGVEPLAAA